MTAGIVSASPATNERRYVGSEVNLTINVKNLSATLTDAATIKFNWKSGLLGPSNSVTPANTSTGVYTASFTPQKEGTVYFRIVTTSPDAAYEGALAIADSRFRS